MESEVYLIMTKLRFLFIIVLLPYFGFAQNSILGVWQTIDDESGEAKSHVEIYEKNGKIYGKVIKLLPAATVKICNNCPGEKNGKSLIGMDILWELRPYKNYWSYGQIIDPKNGKIYSGSVWLEGDQLKLRGYIGISLIGRTQIWHRVK